MDWAIFSPVAASGRGYSREPLLAVNAARQAVQQHGTGRKRPTHRRQRDDIIMSAEDAERMGLKNGDAITLRNEHGSLSGRVRIDRIKPGCLQAHWPEANVIFPPDGWIPAACLITTRRWKSSGKLPGRGRRDNSGSIAD